MSLFRTCDWWEAASSDPGSLQYDVASLVVDSLAGEEDQQVEHCTALYCTVLYCTVLYQQVEQVVAVSMSGLVQIYQPSNHAEVTLRPMLLRFKQDVFTISMRMGPERFIWLKIIARKK